MFLYPWIRHTASPGLPGFPRVDDNGEGAFALPLPLSTASEVDGVEVDGVEVVGVEVVGVEVDAVEVTARGFAISW